MEHIITIDVGTSSMRAILVDEKGVAIYTSSRDYSNTFIYPSMVEQNPLIWRNAAVSTLKEVAVYMSEHGIKGIIAIAITSQRASVIPVGKDGTPLHNAIMWQDKRTIKECDELLATMSMTEIYHKTGLRTNPYFVLPRIMWLKKNEPEKFKNAYKLIGVQDYVAHCLTGQFCTDHSQAARTMLMNIHNFSWDSDMLRIAGLDDSKLCELLPPGSIGGELTNTLASATGLKEGTPVILCGGDQQNAAVALNIIAPGMVEANTGTGSFMITCTDKPAFDPKCRVICSASAIAGKWIVEASIFNTGSMYRWCKEQVYKDIDCTFEHLNLEAEQSPAGANGVMILPHFEGSAAPYWEAMAKGIVFNLSLGTKRSDITRAVVESIALEIADNISLLEAATVPIRAVSIAGGMSKSDFYARVLSSASNRQVVRYGSEATSLGASMIALVSAGVYGTIEEAFDKMADKVSGVFEPDEKEASIYKTLMHRKTTLFNALQEGGVYKEFMEKL